LKATQVGQSLFFVAFTIQLQEAGQCD